MILPLHVVPQDAGKPVTLRLKLDYAVCEKLCVPAKAKLELQLTGAGERNEHHQRRRGAGAQAGRPSATAVAGDLRRASRAGSGKPRVVVDVAAPAGMPSTCSPKGRRRSGRCRCRSRSPARRRAAALRFRLDGLPPGAKPDGATLRLTAVSGDKAIEVGFRLD